MEYKFNPIGTVNSSVKEGSDKNWGNVTSDINLYKQFWGSMKGLEEFSHVIIIYYINPLSIYLRI